MSSEPDFNIETISRVFANCGPKSAEVMKSLMSEYEATLRDGFVARARARGFSKGRRDGLCEAFMMMLERAFGSLDDESRDLAAKAESNEILLLIRRVVQGRCIDALLRIDSAPYEDLGSASQGRRTPNGEPFSEFCLTSSPDASHDGQEYDGNLSSCRERQLERYLDLWEQGTLQNEDSHAVRIFADCAKQQDIAAIETYGRAKGLLCGLQESVLLTLECRFGVIDRDLRPRLAEAGLERVRLWVTEAMRVKSVEGLLR